MSNLESAPIMSKICSYLAKKWQTLTGTRKIVSIVAVCIASAAVAICFTSCGLTRTIVRTAGKGTTNATVSVTTNNPSTVDVSTQIDSIPVRISSKRK